MMLMTLLCSFLAVFAFGRAAAPAVNCPVPVSPPNGQAILFRFGGTVKYLCDPGYELKGVDFARCIDDQWMPEPPTCEPRESAPSESLEKRSEESKPTAPRSLFKWNDNDGKSSDAELNETDVQGDEARFHLLLLPRERVVTKAQRVRSGSELEEEEQKRNKSSSAHPSFIYVRQPLRTGKSVDKENAWLQQYHRAALHMARTGPSGEVEMFQVPDSASYENLLRHLYWSAPYMDPRYASLIAAGHPHVMTLSESQIAWINSLHPEVRDRYLKDLYNIRAGDVDEGARAQAFLRRYEDLANYYYADPYYYRQPLSVLLDDPLRSLDYSCYRTEEDGHVTMIRAPSLPNAYIHRYDRRKNPNHPYNDYLAAEYRCRKGYTLVDYRVNELYCSQRGWVGTLPACVQKN